MTQHNRLLQALVIATAVLFGAFLGSTWTPKRGYGDHKPVKQGFLLTVNLAFQSVQDRDQFIDIYRPLAAYVAENEPNTLMYEMAMADNDPLKVLIFERYPSRNPAYEAVHRTSEPFKRFQAAVKESQLVFEKSGQSYIEADIGFV